MWSRRRSHVYCVELSAGCANRPLSSRNPAGPFRDDPLGIRRNVRGAVSHPRLCLRQRRAMRGAGQGRRPRLHLFALLQSDDFDVRAADDRARRRRSRPLDRNRHGRGNDRGARPAEGRRSFRGLQGDARLIVDNVFATPLWQSPLTLGADVVVYSATKHIDGQGRCLGGMILGTEAFVAEHLHNFMRQTGPSLSPFNAWVLLKGLETLAVRVRAQTEAAAKVADALAKHPKISRLLYPGRADHPQADLVKKQMRAGSTLVGFEVKGGKAAAFRCLNGLKISRISTNLGDAKSLVTHPATTTHQRLTPEARAELGISEGFIRFSAGLEHPDDLIEDLDAALEKA